MQRHASLSWLWRERLQLDEEEVLGGGKRPLSEEGRLSSRCGLGSTEPESAGRAIERDSFRGRVRRGLQARSGRSAEKACRGTFCSACWVEGYRLGESDEAFADDALGSKPPLPDPATVTEGGRRLQPIRHTHRAHFLGSTSQDKDVSRLERLARRVL